MTALRALVRRDLLLFLSDPRAVVVTLAVPIALAAVIGAVFGGSGSHAASPIEIRLTDLDGSEVSRGLAAGLTGDPAVRVRAVAAGVAREEVRRGKAAVAVVIPAGFGDAATGAFFGTAPKPSLGVLRDPSRAAEVGIVRGVLTQHVMEAVSGELSDPAKARGMAERGLARIEQEPEVGGGEKRALTTLLQGVRDYYGQVPAEEASAAGAGTPARRRSGLTVPFAVAEESVAAQSAAYNGYAHAFGGMAVQFVLFLGLEAGLALLEQRRRGLWDRVRAAPISRSTVLLARAISGAILAFGVLLAVMAAGAAGFGVRVHGSALGFVLVSIATAAMVSAFGLLVAALGRTPEATRGLGIFATLLMTMLGGAWFPAFLFPAWMQAATLAVPTRWAMDGLDGVTWRGLGLVDALPPVGALVGFAALFAVLAIWRFRWDPAR